MSVVGNLGSPSKDTVSTSGSLVESENLPRDFSRLSLFSSGSATSQDEQFRCEGHAEHSLSCMQNYLQAGKLCDVTLIAGSNGKKVQAHRLVLSAASEYFAAMFTGSLRESGESEVTLGDVSGDVLQAVVNYCYTGAIDIREDNVETLLATACLMQLHEVVEACSRFLAHQLHPSNCLGIAVFAEHQACTSLLQEANAYTSQNFMQVIRNQEFLQLTVDQMTSLLSNDDLNVTSEEHIFHALMSWIQHDPTTRKPLVGRLLAFVKLPLLTPEFLTDQVEPVVGCDPACQKLIMEAFKWHLLPDRHLQMASTRTRPRKATLGRLLVVGGMDKNKGATTIESYDPRSDAWTVAHHMSGRRLQFGIALLGDKLLVVGGRDGLKTLNTMECLDMETGTWTQLSPMNTHRHGLGVAVLGGTLYAVGGHDGWSYLNNVERKAKKNSYLIDFIDRYKKWRCTRNEESETESENSDSEEPKQESDLDDPWIMTVKGNHSIKLPQEDLTPNHKITNKIQNGSGPTIAKSPPKDSNLNHYRPDKATPSARPQSVVQSPSDNRDREKDADSKDRGKRISRELSPLDHRGEPEVEKKPNRRPGGREHSNGGRTDSRSPCLSGVIYPLISELQRKHHYNGRAADSAHKSNDAIEELKNAFEIAERASPGITENFISEMVKKLMPSVTEQRLRSVMDKVTRFTRCTAIFASWT
ncbi:hypothetical protein Zmor_012427 [Zophobas morio]|uniref:BTB domain-containing protein n=1 Tax=Zophobas morio TaxID=2755281 RepID=A0AA38IDA3_9CUCU|nr:hypothetical protein Zmor_012427 [Zophobas morio]